MLSLEEVEVLLRRRPGATFRRKMRLLRLVAHAVERPLVPAVRFDLSSITNADSKLKFRFDALGLVQLRRLLCIPHVVVTEAGDRCLGDEALCVLLNRLSYPRRYYDMMQTFGRLRESLCRIFNVVVDLLYAEWRDLLFFCLRIVSQRIALYARAVERAGGLMSNIIGFIDGSKIETCRITQKNSRKSCSEDKHGDLQRLIYSGHKRRHCLNFQAVTAPDGLCIHFWGPIEGSRHDTTLLWESKLLAFMDRHEETLGPYLIYGDPAYGVLRWVCSGYKGNSTTQLMQQFNSSMSRVRQSVEWSFCQMKTQWAFVTYKMQQKIMLQNVGKSISIAMLLTNCHTCYYGGNQTSDFFGVTPPTLNEYLTRP